MKKILAVIPALCLGLVSLTAKADPTLTFNSSSGSIGPYNMTLSPGGNLSLFCMDDFLHITPGEFWTVDVVQGSALGTDSRTKTDALLYEEEAYILSQFNGSNNSAVQDALWAVFDSGDVSGLSTGASALYNAAIGGAGTAFINGGGYDNYTYYIFDGGSIDGHTCSRDYKCSDPQNFIGDPTPGPAPEPSSLFLLGSGLVGLAGAARRKLVRR